MNFIALLGLSLGAVVGIEVAGLRDPAQSKSSQPMPPFAIHRIVSIMVSDRQIP